MRPFARLAALAPRLALTAPAFALAATSAAAAPDDVVASPAAPNGKFLRAAEARPGEYLVVLKGAASASRSADEAAALRVAVSSTIDALAARHAARVTSRYSDALLGFAAEMSEADAKALAEDPAVAFVEENGAVHASAVLQPSPTWGLDRVDQTSLPLDTKYLQLGQGEGATIYVIDTGLRASHAEFAGRVLPGFTAIADCLDTGDCNGHGTHVAGTAAGSTYGVAKRANIVPVRVLDCNGNGTNQGVIDGINFIVGKRTPMAVANLSLGGEVSAALDAAVTNAVANGTVMAVAAGNENTDACTSSPARAPAAITVGATALNDSRSSFSNYGACVDLSAPGSDILSAWIDSDTDTNIISGTSMATPHVAGAIAAFRAANPSATPATVALSITGKAVAGKLTNANGSPNLLLNTRFVDSTPPMVSLAAPRAGAKVETDFVLRLNVSEDNLESLALSIDGVLIETRAQGPFEYSLQGIKEGTHVFTAVAKDLAGQMTTSEMTVVVGAGDVDGGCSTRGGAGAGAGLLLALGALLGWRRRGA